MASLNEPGSGDRTEAELEEEKEGGVGERLRELDDELERGKGGETALVQESGERLAETAGGCEGGKR